ncbi:Methyltransferase trt5 [Colletotrichum trifolii]|uniref:Methyltransferase trt5 n=1 Tax=Colletotrichum trifolii TaxID=5466 RepID=A0A4R8QRB9_COLTR|nr:Methyltransferase trt5 [Colletotrichum trifolii]
MVTIARSKNLDGPFESNPGNPILSNANTTNYFQTVGHADLFQDASKKWWGVALSTRAGATYLNFPMVRETVLTSVTWDEGDWPRMTQISGKMSGWEMPRANFDVNGPGPWISNGEVEGDDIDFAPSTKLPSHFAYWRYPIETSYTISPPEHHHSLRLTPSTLNLTGLNGNYAGPTGQTFVGRRQQDTLFTYSVTVDFAPTVEEEEAGVSAFLTQNHHFDLGVVLLPAMAGTQAVPGYSLTGGSPDELRRHIRFRGISYVSVPDDIIAAVPEEWEGKPLSLQIKATNMTHYAFSAGPAAGDSQDRLLDLGTCGGQALRQLTHDGADSSRLFGVDLRPEFLDIGYDLFQDKGRFHATLVAGNVLDPADANLTALNGRVSIVWANAFFHLFDWKQQVAAATRIVGFLRPGIRDALVFGRHLGSVEPKESEDRGRTRFLHDQGSFQRLWDEVGEKTGTRWRVWLEHVAEVGCRFRVTRRGTGEPLCCVSVPGSRIGHREWTILFA